MLEIILTTVSTVLLLLILNTMKTGDKEVGKEKED